MTRQPRQTSIPVFTTFESRLCCSIYLLLFVACSLIAVPPVAADEKRDPTVGAEGRIEQIILPGTELKGKPLTGLAPLVVRVVEVFPHGDSFRYDIQFHGLEPGHYDLREYMERKDGSPTDDLPELKVQIKSLLPPGQIQPNPLGEGWLPRLGGYKVLATIAVIFWFAVLLGLIFLGRKKEAIAGETAKPVTLADLLQPRLTEAAENRMEPAQYAELERMLFAFWRKKLNLETDSADQALAKIKADSEAGPLMKQLEQWLHNPVRDQNIDLAQLLTPYREIPADGFES